MQSHGYLRFKETPLPFYHSLVLMFSSFYAYNTHSYVKNVLGHHYTLRNYTGYIVKRWTLLSVVIMLAFLHRWPGFKSQSQHKFKIIIASHGHFGSRLKWRFRANKPQREGWLIVWKTFRQSSKYRSFLLTGRNVMHGMTAQENLPTLCYQ